MTFTVYVLLVFHTLVALRCTEDSLFLAEFLGDTDL